MTLSLLLLASARQWRKGRQDERPAVQRFAAMDRVMSEARTDQNQCHVCQRVTVVRRLVLLHDDAALCCEGCATILTFQRQEAA
jgi:hypothetical protein